MVGVHGRLLTNTEGQNVQANHRIVPHVSAFHKINNAHANVAAMMGKMNLYLVSVV